MIFLMMVSYIFFGPDNSSESDLTHGAKPNFTDAGFCGPCPSPPPNAPTSVPSLAPVLVDTLAPTSDPLEGCDPIIPCLGGAGVVFCVDGENGGFEICLPVSCWPS